MYLFSTFLKGLRYSYICVCTPPSHMDTHRYRFHPFGLKVAFIYITEISRLFVLSFDFAYFRPGTIVFQRLSALVPFSVLIYGGNTLA